MLDLPDYTFPTEEEVFTRQSYLDRAKAISAKSASERRRITRGGMALGVVAFVSILSIGFGAAAIAERGIQNWQNVRTANVEQ